MRLFIWFIVYSSSSLFLPVSFIIAVIAAFLITPTNEGLRNIGAITTLMSILYMANLNFKFTNIYERKEGFFYFSANLSRFSIILFFTMANLLTVMIFPLVTFDNAGINISFNLFIAVTLYVLFYYFLMMTASVLFRKPQISMLLALFLFIMPMFMINYVSSKSEILMIDALTPMSLTFPIIKLNFNFLIFIAEYLILIIALFGISVSIEKWRSFS